MGFRIIKNLYKYFTNIRLIPNSSSIEKSVELGLFLSLVLLITYKSCRACSLFILPTSKANRWQINPILRQVSALYTLFVVSASIAKLSRSHHYCLTYTPPSSTNESREFLFTNESYDNKMVAQLYNLWSYDVFLNCCVSFNFVYI